jgi:hypothetical protein
MPLMTQDVQMVTRICAQHSHRVRYGVLGAAIMRRAGCPAARPRDYAQRTSQVVATFGITPLASWVVGENGHPNNDGYGYPPNPNYDAAWSVNTTIHEDVDVFLEWLDAARPDWDAELQSACVADEPIDLPVTPMPPMPDPPREPSLRHRFLAWLGRHAVPAIVGLIGTIITAVILTRLGLK